MSSTQAKRKTHPAHTLTLGQSPVCERPSAVSTTQTDSLHMWVLDKILDRVFFPASTALDCTERFVSYIYEAFSSVLGQAAPPHIKSTQPGLQRREAPEGSLGICDVWASSASQSLKPMQSFTKKKDTSDHAHTLEHKVSANSQFVHSMEAYHQATNSAFLHWENKFYLLTCYQQQ